MSDINKSEKQERLGARRLIISALRGPGAARVITPPILIKIAKESLGVDLAETTANHNLAALTRDGFLKNPTRGLYLNMLAEPQPTIAEIAPQVRSGAVISLQYVLGQCGILNNPTPWITCVVPRTQTSKMAGKIDIDGTVFSFSSMKKSAMCEDRPDLALQPYALIPTATPEKALADWIYLAKNSRKWSAPPMFDIDLNALDMKIMDELCIIMEIEKDWTDLKNNTTSTVKTLKKPFGRPGNL